MGPRKPRNAASSGRESMVMAEQPAIGLICAIPQELAELRAALEHDVRHEIGGFGFDRGRLDGRAVILAEAGIGKVNTATVATILALRFSAGMLVFNGVAGGAGTAVWDCEGGVGGRAL